MNWAALGWFDEATFRKVARSFDNPDWVDVTFHSYRLHWGECGFRHAAIACLREHEVVYKLCAQLWSDGDTQPIEEAAIERSVDESPYRTVATLRLPAQDAYSTTRNRYFDEQMTFNPANSLAAHQPLGSVMHARLQVSRTLSAFRQHENGVCPSRTTRHRRRIHLN